MATRTFHLTTTVPVAPSAAIDYLVDLGRHWGMHPYLVSSELVASGEGEDGAWSQWHVVERPNIGPFHYTIRFPAVMVRTSDTSMSGRVRAAPGCTLLTTTRAVAGDDGATVVTETTVVTAPALLVGYMTKHAHIAHARTYSLLPEQFTD